MGDVLTAALFCSALISLLVAVALVLFVLKQLDKPQAKDEEGFSSMAVKESRRLGLLHSGAVSGSVQLQPSKRKPKPNAAKSAADTADVRGAAGTLKSDLASELRLKKHIEIVKWRQDNERIMSASTNDFLTAQMPPPQPPRTSPMTPRRSNLSDKSDTMQSNISVGSE